jgi:hypothetical protein
MLLLRKRIIVKNIDNRESADLQSKSRDVHFLGELQQISVKLLLFASKSPYLTKENVLGH